MPMAEGTTDGYADALRREILRSEQRRMRAVAVILAVLLVATVMSSLLLTDLSHRLFRGGINPLLPLMAIGPFVAYEVLALVFLRWRTFRDKDFPRYGRFANALIETSLPSVIIYGLSHQMNPQSVFAFWPPMLYFIFIVLSTCGSISGCRCGPGPWRRCSSWCWRWGSCRSTWRPTGPRRRSTIMRVAALCCWWPGLSPAWWR
jgi:hypothetical protein